MKSIIFVIIVTLYFLSIKSASAQVVINEFASNTSPEWVELYNIGTSAVDLTGWKIGDSSSNNYNLGGTIPMFGFYVYSHSSGWLNNDTDKIILYDKNSNIIDSVTYGPLGDIAAPAAGQCAGKSAADVQTWMLYSPCTPNTFNPLPTGTPAPTSVPTVSPTLTPSITPTQTATPVPSPTNTSIPKAVIHIANLPSTVALGQNFTLSFTMENAKAGTDYFIKIYGGINDNYSVESNNSSDWLNYTGAAWDQYPKFRSDSSGKISGNILVRAKLDKETGNYKIKAKYHQADGATEDESGISYLTVVAAPPVTATPTPSPTINLSLTPSIEPTQTPDAVEVDNMLNSTIVPTTSPSLILGASDSVMATPTPVAKNSSGLQGYLPMILISMGGLLLLIPLVVSRLP